MFRRSAEEGTAAHRVVGMRVLMTTILVLTVLALFYETQAMHSSAIQASLMSRLTQELQDQPTWTGGSTSSSSSGRFPPFSCSQLLDDLKYNPAMQKKDPNKGFLHPRRTITDPPFYISLHNKTFDKTRWDIMKYGDYYEKKLTEAFREVLSEAPPGSRVLDVGANIGFFSLYSAAQGSFTVDAFEPNLKNRMRFCESLNLNRWFRTEFNNMPNEHEASPTVNLYNFGVGHEEGSFVFSEHSNPGQGSVEEKTTADNQKAIPIITLDALAKERGWFESPQPNIAILKVDVEGNEYSVLEGAKELLQTNMVQNIFMEVSARTKAEKQANVPCLELLSGPANYRLHRVGSWPGPGTRVSWANDDTLVDKILDKAAKEGAKQLNLWWKKIGVDDNKGTFPEIGAQKLSKRNSINKFRMQNKLKLL